MVRNVLIEFTSNHKNLNFEAAPICTTGKFASKQLGATLSYQWERMTY